MRIRGARQINNFCFLLLFLWGGMLFGQSTIQRLQDTTTRFFAQRLNVAMSDLTVTYKHLPRHLEKFKHSKIRVFSQRKELQPGYQTLWVVFSAPDGQLQKKVAIATDVSINRKILVATVDIKRGRMISAGMVRFTQRSLGKDWKSYFFDLNSLSGLEVKQSIRNGRALTNRQFRKVPLVHRGDRIKVEVRNKLLSVSTYGTAIQDGFSGSKIKLKLDATGQVISANINSAGLAVLDQ